MREPQSSRTTFEGTASSLTIRGKIWTVALKRSRGRNSTVTEFGHPVGGNVRWHQAFLQRLRLATAAFRMNTELHTTGYHNVRWQNWQWRISPQQKLETQTSRITGCPFYRVTGHGSFISRRSSTATSCDRCGAKGNNERFTTWPPTQAQVATVRSSAATKTSSQTIYCFVLQLPVIRQLFCLFQSRI